MNATTIALPRELVELVGEVFTGPLTLQVRKGVIMAVEATRRIDLAREREIRS